MQEVCLKIQCQGQFLGHLRTNQSLQLLNTITRSKCKSPNRKYKFGTPFYTQVTECRICTGLNKWWRCTWTDSKYSMHSEKRRWYQGKTRHQITSSSPVHCSHSKRSNKSCSCVKNTSSKNYGLCYVFYKSGFSNFVTKKIQFIVNDAQQFVSEEEWERMKLNGMSRHNSWQQMVHGKLYTLLNRFSLTKTE